MEKKKTAWGKWILALFSLLLGGVWGWSYLLCGISWPEWAAMAMGFTCGMYFIAILALLIPAIGLWIDNRWD